MAKKARKKLEEDAEPPFEFPVFDEPGFIWKEYELTSATALAGLVALALALVCWVLTSIGIAWYFVFPLGLAAVVGGTWVLRRVRPRAEVYTWGDWAGLVALELFGWMSIWFLLVNVAPKGF